MVITELVQLGNPTLKALTIEVGNVKTKAVRQTVRDLIDSMRHHELVGIAAPQIGRPVRIFATEIRPTETRKPDQLDPLRIFINPKITWQSKKLVEIYEGCGSVAHTQLFGPVTRPESLIISAKDEEGKQFNLRANGLLARVIWHEFDHLDGLEFTDRITNNARFMSKEEYIKRVLNK